MGISMVSSSVIFLAFVIFNLLLSTTAAPYQELAPRKGYVPVYIRTGDEPLDNIHPGLAEAFNEGVGEGDKQQLKAASLIAESTEKDAAPAAAELAKTNTEAIVAPNAEPQTQPQPQPQPEEQAKPQPQSQSQPSSTTSTTTSTSTSTSTEKPTSSTESDIASFDVVKSSDALE